MAFICGTLEIHICVLNNEIELVTRDKSIKKCIKIDDFNEEVFNLIKSMSL